MSKKRKKRRGGTLSAFHTIIEDAQPSSYMTKAPWQTEEYDTLCRLIKKYTVASPGGTIPSAYLMGFVKLVYDSESRSALGRAMKRLYPQSKSAISGRLSVWGTNKRIRTGVAMTSDFPLDIIKPLTMRDTALRDESA